MGRSIGAFPIMLREHWPKTYSFGDAVLIQLEPRDLGDLQKLHQDLSVKNFTQAPDSFTEWYYADYIRLNNEILYVIASLKTNETDIMGYVTMTEKAKDQLEVGFAIDSAHRRKGLATQSVAVMCNGAFLQGIRKIMARTFHKNINAQGVLGKLGFHRDGILRKETYHAGEFQDTEIWSLFQDELKNEPDDIHVTQHQL